jgi:hypothetical protein
MLPCGSPVVYDSAMNDRAAYRFEERRPERGRLHARRAVGRGGAVVLALALALLPGADPGRGARAQGTSPVSGASPVYNIEVIVFRASGGPAASEDWTAPAPRPPRAAESGGDAAGGAAVVGRFVGTTSQAQLQLNDLRTRLAASGGYQPLAHVGWSQTASSWGSRAGFTLQRLGISVPGLSGMFYLERGSFLHLGVSLKYAPATGGPTYELAELRRVRAYDKNYYDHPAYGVVAIVTPAQGVRPAGR